MPASALALDLETSGAGIALWDADDTALEPEATSHTADLCGGLFSGYYAASAEYLGSSFNRLRLGDLSETPMLDEVLAQSGFMASDVSLTFGLMSLGDDLEATQWGQDAETLSTWSVYQGGVIGVSLGDEPVLSGLMTSLQVQFDTHACAESGGTYVITSGPITVFDYSGGGTAAAVELAALLLALLGDDPSLTLTFTIADTLASAAPLGSGRMGVVLEPESALLENSVALSCP